MEHELKRYPFQEHGWHFVPPQELVAAALTEIREDGSVVAYDEVEGKWYCKLPKEPVDLQQCSEHEFARHLKFAIDLLEGTMFGLADAPEDSHSWVTHCANWLSAYRDFPEFLDYVANLIRVDEDGWGFSNAHPPFADPTVWVPKLRQELFNHKADLDHVKNR